MKEINFSIVNWFAWAPGLENKEDWRRWANDKKLFSADLTLSPTLDFIEPLARRRLSQLTKMSLKTTFECGKEYGNNIENVFASRYGELNQTLKLMKSISDGESISPAGFSLSVHNSAAGINSVTSKNKKSYTALAACEMTFETAFLEALGRLQNQELVMLTVGEEYVKEISAPQFMPFSLSILIGKNDGEKIKAAIGDSKKNPNYDQENLSLNFLRWLIDSNDSVFSAKLISFTKRTK